MSAAAGLPVIAAVPGVEVVPGVAGAIVVVWLAHELAVLPEAVAWIAAAGPLSTAVVFEAAAGIALAWIREIGVLPGVGAATSAACTLRVSVLSFVLVGQI